MKRENRLMPFYQSADAIFVTHLSQRNMRENARSGNAAQNSGLMRLRASERPYTPSTKGVNRTKQRESDCELLRESISNRASKEEDPNEASKGRQWFVAAFTA